MPEGGICKLSHAEICRNEEYLAFVRAAVKCGVTKVRVTGGEPLIRKGLIPLLAGIREINGVRELCLTTNGTHLREFAPALRAAGVDRLNVSLDTLDAEKYRDMTRGGALDTVLDGICAAENAGFPPVKINTVLIGGWNDGEIPALVELTRETPREVRLIELMPMGPCADWARSAFLPAESVLRMLPGLKPVDAGGVARRYRMPGYAGTVGLIEPIGNCFCETCSRIRITSDGRLKPCLHQSVEIPLRGLPYEALVAAIAEGIRHKPLRHRLFEDGKSQSLRDMNEIGG